MLFNLLEKNHVSASPFRSKGVKCFNCNEYEHMSTKCSDNSSVKKDSCNTKHSSKKKHEKEVNIRGSKFIVLIDIGSDINFIWSDCYIKIETSKLDRRMLRFHGIDNGNNK